MLMLLFKHIFEFLRESYLTAKNSDIFVDNIAKNYAEINDETG